MQYQAKHLFILVLICSVVIAAYSVRMREKHRIRAVLNAQSEVENRLGNPRSGILFKHYSTDILLLNLRLRQISPSTLTGMKDLHIQELELSGTNIRDSDLSVLASVKGLRQLHVAGTSITDDALPAIGMLSTLEELSIGGTNLSDANIRHLSSLKSLSKLSLDQTGVTDEAMTSICEMRQLTSLSIGGTNITDDGVKCVVTLTNLHYLSLENTRIGNAGIQDLQKLHKLLDLNIKGTNISAAGVRQLQEALPKCNVMGDDSQPR